MLAEWALKLSSIVSPSNNEEEIREYQINELLSIFPSLQFGMDVNPKLASGPTGVEYTKNLTAFDLMDIELVHGWLVDPNEVETSSVIGNKTYNELVEAVVMGAEVSNEMERLEKLIKISTARAQVLEGIYQPAGKCALLRDEKCVNFSSSSKEKNGVESMPSKTIAPEEKHDADISVGKDFKISLDSDQELDSRSSLSIADSERLSLISKIDELQKKFDEQNLLYNNSCVINSFLTETSNQLTVSGLTELHTYLQEGSICVFFRNNHFATLTKDGGVLYLLVTDLGYANVSEVIWEKLDDITGDTEYADEFFANLKPKDQSEDYYQLAILLNQNESTIHTQEKRLPATNTCASILRNHITDTAHVQEEILKEKKTSSRKRKQPWTVVEQEALMLAVLGDKQRKKSLPATNTSASIPRNHIIDIAHVQEEILKEKKTSSRKRKQPWTVAEEETLMLAVLGDKQRRETCSDQSNNEADEEDWDEIANFVPGRTPVECLKRYTKGVHSCPANW